MKVAWDAKAIKARLWKNSRVTLQVAKLKCLGAEAWNRNYPGLKVNRGLPIPN